MRCAVVVEGTDLWFARGAGSLARVMGGSAARAIEKVRESIRVSGLSWTASLVLERLLPWPVLGLWPDRTVAADLLRTQVGAILAAWGMSPEHVAITLEHVLYADLSGIDSHGCSMMRHYHRGRAEGWLTMDPVIATVRESPTTALLDGGGGLGHVIADRAMKLAIAKCGEAGIATVAVRNSGHFGAAGSYALLAARAGFIGLATTNTRTPAVVPTHARDAVLGTNPIAFAAPAGRNPPFLLDMATSTASVGKLSVARRRGRAIPRGWALNAAGKPLRNARLAAAARRLTPLGSTREMGSHKGYGLAAMVEILSALVPGLREGRAFADSDAGVGHFFLALDPGRFRERSGFEADLDAMIDTLRAAAPADPRERVQVAGDPERAAWAERSRDGIPLSRSVIEDLRYVAHCARVPFQLDPCR